MTKEEYYQERINTEHLKQRAIWMQVRPSMLYRDYLYYDGEKWICVGGLQEEQIATQVYSEDVNSAVYGYGRSPEDAMEDFDRAWETGEFEVLL